MVNKNLHSLFLFFGFFFGTVVGSTAQKQNADSLAIAKQEVNRDNLGNVNDVFQENFFKALAQRGIENYERAVTALQKCQELKPNNGAVLFELGKNYKSLEEFTNAEIFLKKALSKKEENKDILTELYDVYYLTQNYTKAIEVATKLSKYNIDYYEDLANLYVRTQDYKKALQSLDYIDAEDGQSDYRDALRTKIFNDNPDKSLEEEYLNNELKQFPKESNSYLALIYFYANQQENKKMYQVTEELLKIYPDSKEAHYALYKKHLVEGNNAAAVNSMQTVLEGDINASLKKEVIGDFVLLVNKAPAYEAQLIESLDKQLEQGKSNSELANFYKGKDNSKAILNLEAVLKEKPTDFAAAKDLMLLYLDEKQPQKTIDLAEEFMVIYPSQPLIYLVTGVAENTLENYKEAEEMLLMGLDFLIDNPQMESDFYKQLSVAYQGLGNASEAEKFIKKLDELKKTL